MKQPLTIKQQLQLLKNIDWERMTYLKSGICLELSRLFYKQNKYRIIYNCLSNFIPLFTRKNALQFGAFKTTDYWWKLTNKGYEQRKLFVNWMIQELKKTIN